MEIVPNIHIIDGSVGCNTYLVIDDGLTLIDTGLRGNVPRIYHYLAAMGHEPRDIKRIVLTHAHLDHINCLHQLKQDTGAMVLAGARDAEIIAGQRPLRVGTGLFGAVSVIFKLYYHYVPVPVDVRLKEGDRIPGALDLATMCLPGHSEGNTGLFCGARRTLFSSDAIRVNAKGQLAPPSPRFTPDMKTAVKSIKKIGELEFDVLLPGHGPAVTGAASAKVRELYHSLGQ